MAIQSFICFLPGRLGTSARRSVTFLRRLGGLFAQSVPHPGREASLEPRASLASHGPPCAAVVQRGVHRVVVYPGVYRVVVYPGGMLLYHTQGGREASALRYLARPS